MKNSGEIWKPVVGYEGLYEISSLGRVRSLEKRYIDSMGRDVVKSSFIMKTQINTSTGYPSVSLTMNGKQKKKSIHRILAEAFIPNPDNLPIVNHIDENRQNNSLDNLEWCTISHNLTWGNAPKKKSESIRKHWMENATITPIIKYDLDGNIVQTFPLGIVDAMKTEGYDISKTVYHQNHTCHGFVYLKEGDPFTPIRPIQETLP